MKSNTHVLSLDLILDVMPNGRLSDVHGPVVHLEFRHINNQPFWMIKRMILTLARIPRSAFRGDVLRLEARALPLTCPHAYRFSG